MKLEKLSTETQEGLRLWAKALHDDELLFHAIGSMAEHWAWICFQLQASDDRPEWFPIGKWALIQFIEGQLLIEARELLTESARKS
jgi:hypothetical protein